MTSPSMRAGRCAHYAPLLPFACAGALLVFVVFCLMRSSFIDGAASQKFIRFLCAVSATALQACYALYLL